MSDENFRPSTPRYVESRLGQADLARAAPKEQGFTLLASDEAYVVYDCPELLVAGVTTPDAFDVAIDLIRAAPTLSEEWPRGAVIVLPAAWLGETLEPLEANLASEGITLHFTREADVFAAAAGYLRLYLRDLNETEAALHSKLQPPE